MPVIGKAADDGGMRERHESEEFGVEGHGKGKGAQVAALRESAAGEEVVKELVLGDSVA